MQQQTSPFYQWIDKDTYYQILVVTPPKIQSEARPYIQTTILVRTKTEFSTDEYKIHKGSCDHPYIGSFLPSSGVELKEEFVKALFSNGEPNIKDANNFYESSRSLLQTRAMSQLIAKTWYFFLRAKKEKPKESPKTYWDLFISGEWEKIGSEMLSALITREIFLMDQSTNPSSLDPENLDLYYPLYGLTANTPVSSHKDNENSKTKLTRFLILPNSSAWQGIALSLLIAGQAYRQISVNEDQKDYQLISAPILSTGDIVNSYGLEVNWCEFTGKFEELQLNVNRFSTSYKVSLPYPPIPSEANLSFEEIKNWALAPLEGDPFPFYTGKEFIDIKYVSPPYPYLPLSTT